MTHDASSTGDLMNEDKRKKRETMNREETSAVPASLPNEAHGLIGRQLRNAYRDLLNEPLPDKLAKLIEDLAKSDKGQ